MTIKGVIMEDFSNYKLPSMFIAFPYCSWKCEKDCGKRVCQNSTLASVPIKEIDVNVLVEKYIKNPITKAVVCGGLEPLDSFADLQMFIEELRKKSEDDVVIYTGYKEEEVQNKINILKEQKNIIIKFGRFIPDRQPRYDEVLGITLASDNQYAKRW